MSTKTQDKAEKILRIGVIHGGKIVEERLLKKREVVTVGSDPKNTFVLPGADIPRSVKLFDVKGSVYTLCFTEQMDGKLNVGEAAVDFAGLKSQNLATKQGDSYRVNLNDDSKGKVQVGDVTLRSEQRAQTMLAVRALEDARMRLGKVLQYADNGVSCYDR